VKEIKDCEVCELPFVSEREWEKLCLLCWKESREYKLTKGDLAFRDMRDEYVSLEQSFSELEDELKALQEERDKLRAAAKKLLREAKASREESSGLSKDRVKDLVKLCHPDKHKGSELAEAMTKWLLSQR